MATRGNTSFQKRQKELAQHRKTARREERRLLARGEGDRVPPQDQDEMRSSELEDGGGRLLSRHATTAGWQ